MIKTFVKVGIIGYLYLLIEFIYIISIILMILSKKEKYQNDLAFNIMQIGMYIYQGIVFIRTLNLSITSIALSNYVFYRNNCIILIILIITLFFYLFAINKEVNQKKEV